MYYIIFSILSRDNAVFFIIKLQLSREMETMYIKLCLIYKNVSFVQMTTKNIKL